MIHSHGVIAFSVHCVVWNLKIAPQPCSPGVLAVVALTNEILLKPDTNK